MIEMLAPPWSDERQSSDPHGADLHDRLELIGMRGFWS
jgi:hypothetical protein